VNYPSTFVASRSTGFQHRPAGAAARIGELVLPADLASEASGFAGLLQKGELDLFVLRGPTHNGRGALAAAIAREVGLGVLETQLLRTQNADAARAVCPLSSALGALPLLTAEAHPGERVVRPCFARHGRNIVGIWRT
jgi:hypothetical protein